ncbi:YtxH domain-containing protein [Sporolactobacillus kofuensis]|uniref:YtxH domain-containing protein n=1 Tax=Sporolactobacillus kofuensis TaxID=269672 RepID=A0ABW1WCP0_9BACL|nr:YtxH domain-containing protein [Sporolactobacillus kofuensis]MCO7175913.1 YtxH domain-containing protein [Sporolactobacillus kofuensis]
MSRREANSEGKGIAFFTGLMIGSALGAVAIFLLAAPSGKRVIKDIQKQSISLKGKGSEFIQTAKQKSIELTHQISPAKSEKQDHYEQMIPIPKDY